MDAFPVKLLRLTHNMQTVYLPEIFCYGTVFPVWYAPHLVKDDNPLGRCPEDTRDNAKPPKPTLWLFIGWLVLCGRAWDTAYSGITIDMNVSRNCRGTTFHHRWWCGWVVVHVHDATAVKNGPWVVTSCCLPTNHVGPICLVYGPFLLNSSENGMFPPGTTPGPPLHGLHTNWSWSFPVRFRLSPH